MWVIGDVERQFDLYEHALDELVLPNGRKGMESSIQVGDMGMTEQRHADKVSPRETHKWFRGNKDNPEVASAHPNILEDWGYHPEGDLFWVAGAASVNTQRRTLGVNLFEGEELSEAAMSEVLRVYSELKPSIVLSHDCPSVIRGEMLELIGRENLDGISRTERMLEEMYRAHKPDLWVFGHFHVPHEIRTNKTKFVCLGDFRKGVIEDCIFEIPEFEFSPDGR